MTLGQNESKHSQKKENKNITLEKKHQIKSHEFTKKKNNKGKLEKELKEVISLLEEIDTSKTYDLSYRAELLNKKDNYQKELNDINNNYDEMNYYDKAGDIITKYYEVRNQSTNESSKNILEYLSDKKPEVNTDESISKVALLDKFFQVTEGTRIKKDDGSNRIMYCNNCNVEKFLDYSDSAYKCPECGDVDDIIFDEDRQIKEYSPYKRINHFREWLNQFQARETTEIPDNVYINIVKELNKNRITDLKYLTRDKMQIILKKLGYNHLYEHIPFITNKLSNLPAPKIARNHEAQFIKMFTQIQEPWELYKPKGRKNFLSYPYILYKFCELLELDDLLEYLPMLKSPEKLMDQDITWQKFCKHLKWQFYPTSK